MDLCISHLRISSQDGGLTLVRLFVRVLCRALGALVSDEGVHQGVCRAAGPGPGVPRVSTQVLQQMETLAEPCQTIMEKKYTCNVF